MRQAEQENPTRMSNTVPDSFVGRTFDGYEIVNVIGRGGMGVVYKATQLSLKRPVAIKVLPEDFADHPQFLERFHREVDILSRLSHPNVVTVFERGEVDGRQYVVMEYVQGSSLRELIKTGPLPPADALDIVRSVLAGLEHAHRAGIVHRDIKPENVLIAPGGIVKVADFGLSRLLGPADMTRLTHTHLLLGTFEYMSPEQRERAKEADERSDLYAIGVVLYEMIAGELPIGAFEQLSEKRPQECDRRLDEIVRRSLEKAPEKRYQRASEMGDDISRLLSRALAGEPAVEEKEPEVERAPQTDDDVPHGAWGRRHRRHRLHGESRRDRPTTKGELDESIKAAFDPWASAAYVNGIWWLLMAAAFGVDHNVRFWLLMAAGGTALYFLTVWGLYKKNWYYVLGGIVLGTCVAGGASLIPGRAAPPDWMGDPARAVMETEHGRFYANVPIGRIVGAIPPDFPESALQSAEYDWLDGVTHLPFELDDRSLSLELAAGKLVCQVHALLPHEDTDVDESPVWDLAYAVSYAVEKRFPGVFKADTVANTSPEILGLVHKLPPPGAK